MQEATAKISMMFPVMQQCVVLVLGCEMLDGGETLQIIGYAALAYWTGYGLIMARRHGRLTGADRVLIRWGFLMLCFASLFITRFIWHLRGY
jgi:hypothetical protein